MKSDHKNRQSSLSSDMNEVVESQGDQLTHAEKKLLVF